MLLPPSLGGREETTGTFGCSGERWWGKYVQLNTNHEDVRRRKFTSPTFWGVLSQEIFTLDVTQRTSMLNQGKNSRSLSTPFFSPCYFSYICLADTVFSEYILSFFLPKTTWKLQYSINMWVVKQRFLRLSTFTTVASNFLGTATVHYHINSFQIDRLMLKKNWNGIYSTQIGNKTTEILGFKTLSSFSFHLVTYLLWWRS